MHLRGVLVEPGREHVLGLLDRHAVDMVDLLAGRIVAEAMRRAGEREIVGASIGGQAAPSVSGATRAAVCGDDRPAGAGASGSRLRTITQRT